jgi:hypothetical protein
VLIALLEEDQEAVLRERQVIIRTLVDRIIINSKREVVNEGVIEDSESLQFALLGF